MRNASFYVRVVTIAVISYFGVMPLASAIAQSRAAEPSRGDQPVAKLEKHGWGPKGELVLAIRIHAPHTRDLDLGSHNEEGTVAFSLEESYLVDLYTGKRFEPLEDRVKKPYFGPSGMVVVLAPKGWVQLGIAFPSLPEPPRKEGKVLPYKLRFHPPGGLHPIAFELPFRANTKTPAL